MVALRTLEFMLVAVIVLGYALVTWTVIAAAVPEWELESPTLLLPMAIGTAFPAGVLLACIASIFRVELRHSEVKVLAVFAAAGIVLGPIVGALALTAIWRSG